MAVTINASYNASKDIHKNDRILDNLARKHKGENTGSGCGFGWRDIDYEFPNQGKADAFIAEVAETHPEYRLTDVDY